METEKNKNINIENNDDNNNNKKENDSYVEIVVKLLIDKFISNTVNIVHSKKLNNSMGIFCFEFIKNVIDSFLCGQFICFEDHKKIILKKKNNNINEDNNKEENNSNNNLNKSIDNNNNNNNNNLNLNLSDSNHHITIDLNTLEPEIKNFIPNHKYFFDNPPKVIHNTWEEIEEPECPTLDRNIHRNIIIDYNKNSEDELINEENSRILSQNQTHLKISDSINNPKKQKIKKNSISINSKNNDNISNDNNNNNNKKENKIPLIDLPSFDLPVEKYENEYIIKNNNLENNKLRKEWEELNLIKLNQQKNEQMKKKKEQQKNSSLNNKKLIDGKKITFDSNGKIIYIKQLPSNNYNNNEFFNSKLTIGPDKIIKGTDIRNFFKTVRKSTIRPTKKFDMKLLRAKITNNPFQDDSSSESNDENNNNKKPTSKHQSRKGSKIIKKLINPKTKKQEIIEYNPINNLDDKFNVKKTKIVIENKDKGEIIAAGQNFDIMNPEVGVRIYNEKGNKKEGGFDFVKKYNKSSLKNYDSLKIDNENNNISKIKTNSFINSSNYLTENNSKTNLNSFINENNYNNNSLFNSDTNLNKIYDLNENNNINYNINNVINNNIIENSASFKSHRNKLFSSNSLFKSYDIKRSYRFMRSDFDDEIKLNKIDNLKNYFNDDNNNNNKLKNIYNNFNTEIIKNQNWGNNNYEQSQLKIPFIKPHRTNHIKELGYKIVSMKLPRNRKLYNGDYEKSKKIVPNNVFDLIN